MHEERIKEIFGNLEFELEKNKDSKNPTYVIKSKFSKYFLKFSKEKNIKKDLFGINYFKENLNIKTPTVIEFGKDYLLTEFEGGLERISSREIVDILTDFQEKDFIIKNNSKKSEIPGRLHRKKIDEAFFKNYDYFEKINREDVKIIFLEVDEKEYSVMPRIISHGDIHRGNFFLKNKDAFILDFENICWEYPIFDLAVSIFYSPKDSKEIMNHYLKKQKILKGSPFSEKEIIKFTLADLLRISIHDTLYFYKKRRNHPEFEKRIEHDRFVIQGILKNVVKNL